MQASLNVAFGKHQKHQFRALVSGKIIPPRAKAAASCCRFLLSFLSTPSSRSLRNSRSSCHVAILLDTAKPSETHSCKTGFRLSLSPKSDPPQPPQSHGLQLQPSRHPTENSGIIPPELSPYPFTFLTPCKGGQSACYAVTTDYVVRQRP